MYNMEEKFPPVKFPENGNIQVYDQFPRRYRGGLPEMIEDLPRIAKLGCNVVWINPFQLPGQAQKKKSGKKGSLYAMGNDELFNDDLFPGIDDHNERVKLIQEYTRTARALGLIPMFDLVLSHVGKETTLSEKFGKQGLLKSDGTEKQKSWDDTIPLDYSTEKKQDIILEQLWKPYIEKYIKKYGFAGARIDAITNVDYGLQKNAYKILNDCCVDFNGTPAVIMGELMVKNPSKYVNRLKNVGFTHVFAPASLYRNFTSYIPNTEYESANCWFIEQAQYLQPIVLNKLTGTGGIIGIIGNHDTSTLRGLTQLNLEDYEGDNLHEAIRHNFPKVMVPCLSELKEKIFHIVFTCNGGFYMLAGDEFGTLHRPEVFDDYKETVKPYWGGDIDVSSYFCLINTILKNMPQTCLGDWVKFKEENIEGITLQTVIRYSKKENKNYVICSSDSRLPELSLN